jgi:hypothetical protein
MKPIIVRFNKENPYWEKDPEYLKLFIRYRLNYLNGSLQVHGYIYLNQIYENLGLVWNPEQVNRLILRDEYEGIDFSIEEATETRMVVEISFIQA